MHISVKKKQTKHKTPHLVFENKGDIHTTTASFLPVQTLMVSISSVLKSLKFSGRQDKLFFAFQKVGCTCTYWKLDKSRWQALHKPSE